MKSWRSILSSACIIAISMITITCHDQHIEKLEVSAISAPKTAQYGGPLMIRPKIVYGESIISVGTNFVGDNKLTVMGWTLVNIDTNDPITIIGDEDHDIIIGTGSVKKGQGKTIDLRTLNVMTTHEIKTLLKSKEPVSKAQGAWVLGEIGNETAIPLLLKLLKDDHWVVRRYALLSLYQLADLDQTITTALESMKDDNGKVVVLAIKILMEKGWKDNRFIDALKNLEHEDWKVKKTSKLALDKIRAKTALQDTIRSQRED